MQLIDQNLIFSFRLSITVAILSTLLVTIVGVIISYFLSIKKIPFANLIETIFTLPMVLPPTVVGYYLLVTFGKHGPLGQILNYLDISFIFNWKGALVASFVVSLPLMLRTTKASFDSLDRDYIDVAKTLGKSNLQILFKIILPLTKNGIVAGSILAFVRALGEFGATLMICGNIPGKTETIPLAIYSYVSSGDWNKANLIAIFYTLFTGGLILISKRIWRKV